MDSVERVRRAISFRHPDRVPMLFFNRDREKGDLVMIDLQNHFGGPDGRTSEWGFVWDRLDATMGQPKEPLIRDWAADFPRLRPPAADAENRLRRIGAQKRAAAEGQYLLGSLQLSGFTVMTFLRGFEAVMEDFYAEPEALGALADLVFGFETELIALAARAGLHGVAFFDDWGTQSGLMISPALWRSFFRPRYQKQFETAHALGLDVYFHCCGKIDPLIPEFFDIGVDMLNLSQPNLYDMEALGAKYGGRRCFVIPVSYQTTSLRGTRAEIFADVKRAVDCLGGRGGGLIGYLEDYASMGMSEENYQSCADAFRQLGKYE
jgi:uroporphyrinogen decarboxylase